MIRRVLILLIFVTHAVSESCVMYTFEEDFNEFFTNELGIQCVSRPFWIVGTYSNLDLTAPNERSTSFITPLTELSCVSSFIFSMTAGGTIEVKTYMEAADDTSDQIVVIANQLDITGDRVTGMDANSASDPSFVSGWHTLRMALTGTETFNGYISIMGTASPDSIVLVDSFRYIPPGMDESECQLYEDITTPDPTPVPDPDPTPGLDPDPTPVPDPDPTPVPDPDPTHIPDPDPTPVPDPDLTPVPDPDSTPIPDPDLTPDPEPDPTPVTDPDPTPVPDPDPTPVPDPDPQTTVESTTTTTVTDNEITTQTNTGMDTNPTDLDDTGAPTPYPSPTPPTDSEDTKGFWTPLTITMLVLLYLIVLALICLLFYEIGRRRGKGAAAADDFDFESLPSSFKVPRVKTVYPDARTNPYARRTSW